MKKIILLVLILFLIISCSDENINENIAHKINIIDEIWNQWLDKALILYKNKDKRILAAKQEVKQEKIEEEKRILAEKKRRR